MPVIVKKATPAAVAQPVATKAEAVAPTKPKKAPTQVPPKAVPVAVTTVTQPDGAVTETTENLEAVEAGGCSLSVGMGVTRSIGEFESIKFRVDLTVPCTPDADAIEATFAEAKEWCEGKLNDFNAEVDAQLQPEAAPE